MRFPNDHFRCGVPKASCSGIQIIIIIVQVSRPAKRSDASCRTSAIVMPEKPGRRIKVDKTLTRRNQQ